MRRAGDILAAGGWAPAQRVGSIRLTWEERHRRRILLSDDDGVEFFLDLPKAHLMTAGEGLVLDDGGIIEVVAADEPVADIHARDPAAILRIAWHIGNRHTPLQVLDGETLRIRHDPILIVMVAQLGADVTRSHAPFAPEGGAYANRSGGHGHDHG